MEESNINIQKKRLEQFLLDLEFTYKQLQKSHPQGKKDKALLECRVLLEEAKRIQRENNTSQFSTDSAPFDTKTTSSGLIGHLQIRFKKNVLKIKR
ncbi:MAG TPA: hypothetical protein PK886_02870 [Candidatus Paceibacterota bacterium]|nr:hypothetical protein [Candidatus Paceibacterota bacterium]